MGKTSASSNSESSGDRKLEMKVFNEKFSAALCSRTISKPDKQKKLKVFEFSSLIECLLEIKATSASQPDEIKVNCKGSSDLVLTKSTGLKVFNEVPDLPVFELDHLGATYKSPTVKRIFGKLSRVKRKIGERTRRIPRMCRWRDISIMCRWRDISISNYVPSPDTTGLCNSFTRCHITP